MKTIIVTGGAQGIGRGICQYLLHQEYRVVIADIDAEAGRECLNAFREHTERLRFFLTDVGDEAAVLACIEQTLGTFRRIDGLVNNAGIAHPDAGPVEMLALGDWERVIRTNLTGPFLMAKHAAPHLRTAKGAIVNIASTRALQSEKDSEAYAASKGGLVALTHALAVSLGPEVRVNCISPGWIEVSEWKKAVDRQPAVLSDIDFSQHPAGRVGEPYDVAAMAEYLLSDAAKFITGQNIVIDGGMTRKMIYAE